MSRHQVALIVTAGVCILALVSWVGELDLGLGQLLDPPTPSGAPAPAGAPAGAPAAGPAQASHASPLHP